MKNIMKNIMKIAVSAALMMGLQGCAELQYYNPPAPASDNVNQYSFNVSRSYNDTWAALIEHVSTNYTAIDSYEKASGLIIFPFKKGEANDYVDCGVFTGQPYVEYLTETLGSKLSGSVNIFVREISRSETKIKITANYNFSSSYARWIFNTNGSDIFIVPGETLERVCKPTFKIENELYNGIQEALGNQAH